MGTVVVSVDAELGWGFHDLESPPWERIEAGRAGWGTLLDLAERYEVPMTWAVVGHLLQEECDGEHGEVPAPSGWFDHERPPDAWPPSVRFGRDLVQDVRSSPVDHDVGCHTFSHVVFGAEGTDEALARAELRAFDRVADRLGLSPTSFVFPRNLVGHREVLAEFGYDCYRGQSPFEPGPSTAAWVKHVLTKATLLQGPDPLVQPSVDEYGLVNVPASMFLFDLRGAARNVLEAIKGDPVVERAKRGIDAAAESDGVFHVWLHPNDLGTDRDARRIDDLFRHLDRRRSSTELEVLTMDDVARRVRASQSTS